MLRPGNPGRGNVRALEGIPSMFPVCEAGRKTGQGMVTRGNPALLLPPPSFLGAPQHLPTPPHRHCTLSPTRRGSLGGDRLREEGAVTGIFSSRSPANPDCHHNPHPRTPSRTRSACLGSREGGGAGEDIAQGCQLLGRYPRKEVCSYTRDLPGDLGETVPPLTLRWSKPEILKKNSSLHHPSLANSHLPRWEAQVYPKNNCNNFPKGRQMRDGGGLRMGVPERFQLRTKSANESASYHWFDFQAPLQWTETGPLKSGKVTQLLQRRGRPSGTSPCRRCDLPRLPASPPPAPSVRGAPVENGDSRAESCRPVWAGPGGLCKFRWAFTPGAEKRKKGKRAAVQSSPDSRVSSRLATALTALTPNRTANAGRKDHLQPGLANSLLHTGGTTPVPAQWLLSPRDALL